MNKLTVDLIEEFVASLNLSGQVISATYSATEDETALTLENPYHLRRYMILYLDGNPHTVTKVVGTTFYVAGDQTANADTYAIDPPFYFHGTPMQTNAELVERNHEDKLPLVYLYEVLRERELGEDSNIEREAELRLFFLDSANFEDWSTDDHYTQRLLGLNALVTAFKEQALLFTKKFYLYATVFTRVNHAKWGTFSDLKGHITNVFDDELTGVELTFTLPIRRSCN